MSKQKVHVIMTNTPKEDRMVTVPEIKRARRNQIIINGVIVALRVAKVFADVSAAKK